MKLKIILVTLLVTITCVGLLLTMGLKKEDKNEICPQLIVNVVSIGKSNYVSANQVFDLLNVKGLNPKDKKISEIRLDKIRETVETNLAVKKAKCFFTKKGELQIDIFQRKPFFKVMGETNYYVDNERIIFKTLPDFEADVPIVKGKFTEKFAKNELFDFIKFVQNDNFLSKLVTKIYIEKGIVKFTPRIGNHTIIVGKLKNSEGVYDFEKKFERLKKFYSKGVLNKFGWDKYSEIDLRFDKQVVCR